MMDEYIVIHKGYTYRFDLNGEEPIHSESDAINIAKTAADAKCHFPAEARVYQLVRVIPPKQEKS